MRVLFCYTISSDVGRVPINIGFVRLVNVHLVDVRVFHMTSGLHTLSSCFPLMVGVRSYSCNFFGRTMEHLTVMSQLGPQSQLGMGRDRFRTLLTYWCA